MPPGRIGRGKFRAPEMRVVAAREAGRLLAEHGPADLQGLLEALHALGDRREVEAVARVLVVVPGRADAEDGPARGDDVEGRHHLGQIGRVAVGDARHHRAEAGPLGPRRDGGEQRVAPRAWDRCGVRRCRSGRSGPSPTPSRSPDSSAATAIWATRSNSSPSATPAKVKFGICRPKRVTRMAPDLPAAVARASRSIAKDDDVPTIAPDWHNRGRVVSIRGGELAARFAG